MYSRVIRLSKTFSSRRSIPSHISYLQDKSRKDKDQEQLAFEIELATCLCSPEMKSDHTMEKKEEKKTNF